MPKIRTIEISYTVNSNEHTREANIMYDTNRKVFYIVIPEDFKDAINNMPDDLKEKYHVKDARGIRGMYGVNAIIHEQESVLINELRYLYHYCGNALKVVKNVIIVWCKGNSSEKTNRYDRQEGNKESKDLEQKFKFILAIETRVGVGTPVYTWQNVTYTNTINLSYYNENPIVIDDTSENRLFLSDIYEKLDNLIINLQRFFKDSDSVLQLIASNQKLLS